MLVRSVAEFAVYWHAYQKFRLIWVVPVHIQSSTMDWKSVIQQRLESRNIKEAATFQNLINYCKFVPYIARDSHATVNDRSFFFLSRQQNLWQCHPVTCAERSARDADHPRKRWQWFHAVRKNISVGTESTRTARRADGVASATRRKCSDDYRFKLQTAIDWAGDY